MKYKQKRTHVSNFSNDLCLCTASWEEASSMDCRGNLLITAAFCGHLCPLTRVSLRQCESSQHPKRCAAIEVTLWLTISTASKLKLLQYFCKDNFRMPLNKAQSMQRVDWHAASCCIEHSALMILVHGPLVQNAVEVQPKLVFMLDGYFPLMSGILLAQLTSAEKNLGSYNCISTVDMQT